MVSFYQTAGAAAWAGFEKGPSGNPTDRRQARALRSSSRANASSSLMSASHRRLV